MRAGRSWRCSAYYVDVVCVLRQFDRSLLLLNEGFISGFLVVRAWRVRAAAACGKADSGYSRSIRVMSAFVGPLVLACTNTSHFVWVFGTDGGTSLITVNVARATVPEPKGCFLNP